MALNGRSTGLERLLSSPVDTGPRLRKYGIVGQGTISPSVDTDGDLDGDTQETKRSVPSQFPRHENRTDTSFHLVRGWSGLHGKGSSGVRVTMEVSGRKGGHEKPVRTSVRVPSDGRKRQKPSVKGSNTYWPSFLTKRLQSRVEPTTVQLEILRYISPISSPSYRHSLYEGLLRGWCGYRSHVVVPPDLILLLYKFQVEYM